MIRDRFKEPYSQQTSYTGNRRRDINFEIVDWVYLNISPMIGVMRFGKKGKLIPRYEGHYEILKQVRKVAYELKLPCDLAPVYLLFLVSMLKKYIGERCLSSRLKV